MDDLISRQAAIELIHSLYPSAPIMRRNRERWEKKYKPYIEAEKALEMLPPVQPEITDEQAIGHLQASGWMQIHDKQMYEMGLKERLADDSDSYDALLPSSQPEINCSEIPNTSDFVSRKAVRDMVSAWAYDLMEQGDLNMALHDVDELQTAQPEVIHCKDCKHYRTTGAFGVPLKKEEYYCDEEQRELPEWWFCAGAERKQK